MNYSLETIEEAINRIYELGLQNVNKEVLKSLMIGNCAEIEGDKIRADYEARYRKNDDNAWLLAA